jgi:hypothetical protein
MRRKHAAEARRLRDLGLLQRQIAERMGISRSYAGDLLTDPDGSRGRARKDSYRQPCPECGRLMSGGGGPNVSPERCRVCAAADPPSRTWTRETIIAAIRLFAERHGRPPTASEWNPTYTGGTEALRLAGYPPAGVVYRTSSRSGAPFATWADAIEAAGFPRPTFGRRTDKEGQMAKQNREGYVILRERGDGAWELVLESDSRNQVGALNEALDGATPEGRWIAVPGRYWHPRTLRPRTVYDWSDEADEVLSEAEQIRA